MASAVLPLLNSVPVLTGADNYDSWKRNMRNILTLLQQDGSDCSALDMCEDTVTVTSDAAKLAKRAQVEKIAIAAINTRVAEGLISVSYTLVRDLWVALENMYGTAGPAAIYFMYQATLGFTISGNKDPSAEIANFEQIYNCLQSAGVDIPALVQAMTLLRSVPSSWNIASSFLAAKSSVNDVTYQNVRAAILTEFNQCRTSQAQANKFSGMRRGNQKPQWKPQGNQQQQQQQQQPQGQQHQSPQG
ncbi:hypothetical protein AGABI1DRAFT_133462 [Agaricus bisporus var. burnettii JB137-S8]|uniref:DUF4219 domain-containing protein n=1 Tax=Agaricus bisporus var. burnettii (strain JB137-S8 / ATCC MYA-4627 / FGSC 10392) TaxID=597362 RepID=K5WUL2_AGABU|nr:uncharacterized protein AGABI1DRAFT_133462 [Agaricus bisporus var. burnettii JB137-S8]EKM74247.1 hypothetical protein AGABI1DRAFT_133462 [Agaricus bisporus var. burnettii JB137-S8]